MSLEKAIAAQLAALPTRQDRRLQHEQRTARDAYSAVMNAYRMLRLREEFTLQQKLREEAAQATQGKESVAPTPPPIPVPENVTDQHHGGERREPTVEDVLSELGRMALDDVGNTTLGGIPGAPSPESDSPLPDAGQPGVDAQPKSKAAKPESAPEPGPERPRIKRPPRPKSPSEGRSEEYTISQIDFGEGEERTFMSRFDSRMGEITINRGHPNYKAAFASPRPRDAMEYLGRIFCDVLGAVEAQAAYQAKKRSAEEAIFFQTRISQELFFSAFPPGKARKRS